LATVVLASLGTARARANDAKVQANMVNMRAEMELNANGGSYACAPAQTKYTVANAVMVCNASASAWAASHPLTTGSFCVDSAGAAKSVALVPGTNYICP